MGDKFFEDVRADLDEIAQRLASADAAERRVAVLALAEAAEPGAELLLIGALCDPDASVRREAAKGLDQFDSLATARALAGALLDDDESVADRRRYEPHRAEIAAGRAAASRPHCS